MIPFFIGICIAVLTAIFYSGNYDNFDIVVSSMLDVWGILLGFMIAAVSVLLSFSDGKFITILKQSGHYKTVLLSFMYCCFHLLVALCFAIVIIIYGLKSVVVFNLICGFTADTLVIVGECLYLLLCIVIKVE